MGDDEISQRICQFGWPYQTNTLPKGATGRKPEKNVNSWLEPSHELNLPIPISKLVEGISLFLKSSEYCIRRVAAQEPGGERVCRDILPCLPAVFP